MLDVGAYDVGPLAEVAAKVKAVCTALQRPGTDPMVDFDERGTCCAWLRRPTLRRSIWSFGQMCSVRSRSPGRRGCTPRATPRIPNIAEAVDQTLTRDEPDRLSAQLRPKSSKGPDDNDARRRLPVGHPTSRIGPGGAHVPRA